MADKSYRKSFPVPIQIYITPQMKTLLERRAHREHLPVSELIRRYITQGLKAKTDRMLGD